MGCACSGQKHRKDSKGKGHGHHNSSNSNASHVSIDLTFELHCEKQDRFLFILLMSADSVCVILLEYYTQLIFKFRHFYYVFFLKKILVNKQMNTFIYSCQEITGSKAAIKVIHLNLLLWNLASGESFSLSTNYSLIKNHSHNPAGCRSCVQESKRSESVITCYGYAIEGNVTDGIDLFELHFWTDLIFFSDEDIVIAQYDFQPASDHDLQFKKGDRLKVIKEWVLFFW